MPRIKRSIGKLAKYVGIAKTKRRLLDSIDAPGFRKSIMKVGGATITAVQNSAGYGYSMIEGGAEALFEWFSWANDPDNTAGVIFQSEVGTDGMKTSLNVRVIDPEAEIPEYEIYSDVLVQSLPAVPPRIHHHPDGIMLRTGLGSRYSQNLNLEASALEVLGTQQIFSVQPTVFLDEDTTVFGPAAYPATSGHIYKVQDPITEEIKTYCLTYNLYNRTMVLWDVANPSVVIDGAVIGQSGWWTSGLDQRPDFYFSRDGSRAVALMGTFRGGAVDFYDYHIGYTELLIEVAVDGFTITIVNDSELLTTDEVHGFSTGKVPIAADFSYEDANNSMIFAYAELRGVAAAAEANPDYDEESDSPLEKYRYYAPLQNGGQTTEYTGTPFYTSFPFVDLVMESENPELGEIFRRTMSVSPRSAIPSGFAADYQGVLSGMDLRYRAANLYLFSEEAVVLSSQAFNIQQVAYATSFTTAYEGLRPAGHSVAIGGPTDATVLLPQVIGRTAGGIGLDHQGEIYVHPHVNLRSWVTSYGFFGSGPRFDAVYDSTTVTHAGYVLGGLSGGFATEYHKFVPDLPEDQLNGVIIDTYDFSEPQPTIAWDYNASLSAARWPTPVRAGVWIVYDRDTSGIG